MGIFCEVVAITNLGLTGGEMLESRFRRRFDKWYPSAVCQTRFLSSLLFLFIPFSHPVVSFPSIFLFIYHLIKRHT